MDDEQIPKPNKDVGLVVSMKSKSLLTMFCKMSRFMLFPSMLS